MPQGSDLYLWRAKSTTRRFTWLGEADGGGTVRLAWPPRTAAIAWPLATLPLIGGRSYRSNDDGVTDKFVDLEVVSLPPDAIPQDADALATLLLEPRVRGPVRIVRQCTRTDSGRRCRRLTGIFATMGDFFETTKRP